jgi:hypothetical protein
MFHHSPRLAALLLASAGLLHADITIEPSPAGAVVKADGQPFTEYVTLSENKPILWPIYGPTGTRMTREFPMTTVDGETHDHPHHRSLWFSHMEVNGYNFWAEKASFSDAKKSADELAKLGMQKHRAFTKLEGGKDKGVIVSVTDWIAPTGEKVLEDERRLTFSTSADARIIDYDIDLRATEGDVTFGDNKDGVFGLRVPTSMDVDAPKGAPAKATPGHIITSEGLSDAAAWGKPASWVDFNGKVGADDLGIAILNHPSSFRYPTTWHVRTYGLFCANCFGLQDFDKTAASGEHKLAKGDTLKFRYRVIFHKGDEKAAKISEVFSEYAKQAK